MKKFYAKSVNGDLMMSAEQQMLRTRYITSFKPDDILVEIIDKHRPQKTGKQLGAWFGLFAKMVVTEFEDRGWDTSYIFRLDKPTGIAITIPLLKEYMCAVCPAYNKEGKQVTIREMDTEIMAKFFDDCRCFAASQWSINVPEPDPKWKKRLSEV